MAIEHPERRAPDHKGMRALAATFVEANPDLFASFRTDAVVEPTIRTLGTWGSESELCALSLALECPIEVWQKTRDGNNDHLKLLSRYGRGKDDADPDASHPVRLEFDRERQHYTALIEPNAACGKCGRIHRHHRLMRGRRHMSNFKA